MKKILSTVAFLASAFGAVAAHAGSITLYTDDNFRGPSLTLRGNESDLVRRGFNDRASSVVVQSGSWEVCEHVDYGGRCMVLKPGEYRSLPGFNDMMTSLREVRDRDGYGGGRDDHHGRDDRDDRGHGRGGWGGRHDDAVALFSSGDFRGREMGIDRDVRTLDDYDFNDKAGSIIIREGVWEACEHADFRGRCITLRPGRYERLDGLNNKISSLRRVR